MKQDNTKLKKDWYMDEKNKKIKYKIKQKEKNKKRMNDILNK